jgi:hypothetical protein
MAIKAHSELANSDKHPVVTFVFLQFGGLHKTIETKDWRKMLTIFHLPKKMQ